MRATVGFLSIALTALAIGCSGNPDIQPPAPSGSSGTSGGGGTPTSAAAIALVATPSTVTVNGTVSIQATVTTSGGGNVSDGTLVSFTVSNSSLGTVTPQATTNNGVAVATFTALTLAGAVTVTASSGTVSQTVTITITAPTTGSIEFVSASPTVIGVRGGGQTETSLVTFLVKDVNGNPVLDGVSVDFTMLGPSGGRLPSAGGEYIGPNDATPTQASASTVGGNATVRLSSGVIAGPVTITASIIVGTQTLSSASTPLSIGGGVPSMTHFTLARTVVNLAGLAYVNLQSTVSAFLADRFGNFNVLQGTSVSFYTEAGAVDRSGITDATGITSVTFRTQDPMPMTPAAAYAFAPPVVLTGNPNDGISGVIAVTSGEECFVDDNGNGLFDGVGTDTFPASCDIGEPYIDQNDDGVFNAASEFYIDTNQNGSYDGPNGVWDGNLLIWKEIEIAFTGNPSQIAVNPNIFNVPNGGSQIFDLCVADVYANSIMAGSTVGVTKDGAGTLANGGPFTLPDILRGPYCIQFSLSDSNTNETDPADTSSLTITVTWKVPGQGDIVYSRVITGTVD